MKLKGAIYRITNFAENKVYIGKASHGFSHRYRGGKWWKHTHNRELKSDYERLGPDSFFTDLIIYDLSEEETKECETFLIGSHNSIFPNGYNHVRQGHAISELTRKRMSESGKRRMQIYTNPFKGKKHSYQTRQELREINTGKKLSEEHKEKIRKGSKKGLESAWYTTMSTESKAKVHASRKNATPANKKPVLQLNIKSGNTIAEFESINAASKALNLNFQNISFSCHSAAKTCGGFKWMFKDGSSPQSGYPLKSTKRSVVRIGKNSQDEIFTSISEGARSVHTSTGNLAAAVKNEWKCGGHYWKYNDEIA